VAWVNDQVPPVPVDRRRQIVMLDWLSADHAMLDHFIVTLIDISLVLFGAVIVALLFAANEIGFWIGRRRALSRPAHDRDLNGIATITAGMLGLLAFTLSLTINIAQNRFENRRGLVVQEANAIEAAWLRAKLVSGETGPVITALVETFGKVQLAYVSSDDFGVEPNLILQKKELQKQIWQAMQTLYREQPTTSTADLVSALIEMFNAAQTERFAFESRVPPNMSWMLMAGSLLAIGAMGYHSGVSHSRQIVLTWLLLVMWAGGMALVADLNRPRIGSVRVDPAPLAWMVLDFDQRR
jgi:hypothetical protein